MDDRTPSWGIDPVPERFRTLGLFDQLALWGNLGVSLLVLVIGALLVPALTLRDALLAILVGGLIGNAMVGTAGLIGADARVPSMVLLRAPLGRRGSYIPTALNAVQCLGWATFELIIIAAAASALSDELFGFEAKAAWTIFFGILAAAFALLGPVGFVRRILRRFGVWIVLASLVYLSWWALSEADLRALWNAPAEGGSSFWLGVDLVIAITVSWVPLVADYTRFSHDRRSAFWGSGAGYFLGGTWMLALGVFIVLSRGVSDPVEIPPAVAAAGLAAALALLAVTLDETDEAFANVYSAAVSLQNVFSDLQQRVLIVAIAAIATVGALVIELRNYESFLLLLGLLLRAALRRPARGLAPRRRPLHALSDLRRSGLAARAAPRLDPRLRALPLAARAATRPVVVGGRRRGDGPAEPRHRRLAPQLRGLVRARPRAQLPRLPVAPTCFQVVRIGPQ